MWIPRAFLRHSCHGGWGGFDRHHLRRGPPSGSFCCQIGPNLGLQPHGCRMFLWTGVSDSLGSEPVGGSLVGFLGISGGSRHRQTAKLQVVAGALFVERPAEIPSGASSCLFLSAPNLRVGDMNAAAGSGLGLHSRCKGLPGKLEVCTEQTSAYGGDRRGGPAWFRKHL